jgi:transketolase
MKYTTESGSSLGMNHFGESAPAEDLFKEFGFTVENIVTLVEHLAIRIFNMLKFPFMPAWH